MTDNDWVVLSNMIVAVVGIISALVTVLVAEHDAVRAVKQVAINAIWAIAGKKPPQQPPSGRHEKGEHTDRHEKHEDDE